MDMSSKQGDKAILDCIPSFTSKEDTITFAKKSTCTTNYRLI